MKKLLLIFALTLLPLIGLSKSKQVKNPPYTLSMSPFAEIGSVTLTDTSTVIVMEAFTSPGAWISLPKTTYLQAGDKTYALKSSKGLIIDEPFYLPQSGRDNFTLYFEPLPADTKRFDFIDSLGRYGFVFFDIDLSGELPPLELDPKIANQKYDYTTPMPEAIMKAGKVRLTGKILDYNPLFWNVYSVYSSQGLSARRVEIPLSPKSDGTFDIEFDIPHTIEITLDIPIGDQVSAIVSPGETVELVINSREIVRQASKLRNTPPLYGKPIYYLSGSWAALNDELMTTGFPRPSNPDLGEKILGMNIEQYRDYILKFANDSHNDAQKNKDYSDNLKKWIDLQLDMTTFHLLTSYNWMLESANRKAQKLEYDQPLTGFTPLEKPTPEYFAPLKQLKLDNDLAQVCKMTSGVAMSLSYIISQFDPRNITNTIDILEKSDQTSPEDKQLLQNFKDSPSQETFDKIQPLIEKYSDFIAQLSQNAPKVELSDILTLDKGYIADMIATQYHAQMMEQMQPVTIEQMTQLYEKVKNPVIMETLSDANDKLLAKIEASKQKTGYTIIDVSDIAPQNVLQSIIDRHKGKVLFIDFWATWCGPCRNAMTQSEPVKKFFEDKDVVFIYITNTTSPDAAWRTMIADIPGEHYVLNKEQDKHMTTVEYQYRGIPSYAIIGRDGEKKHFQTGFMGIPEMKRLIEEQLTQ